MPVLLPSSGCLIPQPSCERDEHACEAGWKCYDLCRFNYAQAACENVTNCKWQLASEGVDNFVCTPQTDLCSPLSKDECGKHSESCLPDAACLDLAYDCSDAGDEH